MNAVTEFGSNIGLLWAADPRMVGIRMARYKFVAKMLTGAGRVLEVGAGDGSFAQIVRQAVGELVCCDKEPQSPSVQRSDFSVHSPRGTFDAVYALDVLEHVPPHLEDEFLANVARALAPRGTCIIGMPSLESQPYACDISRRGHVNCKTEDGLRELMGRHFHNVYLFGMNDEVLHTGYGPMCHYRLAIATGAR
jgi:SAM-dependent methyltransferase